MFLRRPGDAGTLWRAVVAHWHPIMTEHESPYHPPAEMLRTDPSEAWGQRIRNAIICGLGVLVFLYITAEVAWWFSGHTRPVVLDVASSMLAWSAILACFGMWFYDRSVAGRVLLDCGPQPVRWLLLISASILLGRGVLGGFSAWSASATSSTDSPVLSILLGVFFLYMATGRLQFRENDIWAYLHLVPWSQVDSYRWANDSTLVVRHKPAPLLMRVRLHVPPAYRCAVEDLVAKRCSAKAVAERG